MTDDSHSRHEPLGLSGADIVRGFGDEIRKALNDAVNDAESRIDVAARNIISRYRFRMALGAAALLVGSGLMSAGLVWIINPPSRTISVISVRHADGLDETCVLVPDSPRDNPLLVCRLDLLARPSGSAK